MTDWGFVAHFVIFCVLTSIVVAATRYDEPKWVLRDAARLSAIFLASVAALSIVLLLFEI